MNCGTGPSTPSQWHVPWPTPPNFSSATHLSWVILYDPPPARRREGRSMGVLEERHPGQFAFSLANGSSPDTQLWTAAPFLAQLILVADEPRSRVIGHSMKICFEDIHLCRNLLEGVLTRPLVDGLLQDWGENPKCVKLLNVLTVLLFLQSCADNSLEQFQCTLGICFEPLDKSSSR